MCYGKCRIESVAAADADAEISSDIATYMKTNFYRMRSLLLALLLRKTRNKGPRCAQQSQNLCAVTPTRVCSSVDHGRSRLVE